MERTTIEAPRRHGNAVRMRGRLALVGLLAAAGILSVTTNAFATEPLSSVILAQTLPGLTAAPPGTLNGPLTQSDLAQVTGSSGQDEADLGQLLASGGLTAYVRDFAHQPADGDGVIITAYQFGTAPEESAMVTGLTDSLKNRAGVTPLTVPFVPTALGIEAHPSANGVPFTEYAVFFEKGDLLFEVQVVSESGDLTGANAVTLAQQQYESAPDTPAPPAGTISNTLKIGVAAGVLVACIALVAIGRRRRYPTALTAFGTGAGYRTMAPAFTPPGPWGVQAFPAGPPKVGAGQWQ